MDQVAHVEACRLCANFYVAGAGVDFVSLFEPLAGLEQQLEFLHTQSRSWQLQISANDGLPQRICANCFTQFCNIQIFRQQCELAQQKLLQSFVGIGAAGHNATETAQQQPNAHTSPPLQAVATDLANDSELLAGLKIETPVTNADLMASLDCLQPPTTSAEVIASLDGLQLPASVAETLSMLTQEFTTLQNGSLLESGANSITTHANMDTKTEETNVLQLTVPASTQNLYYAQHAPISAATITTTPITPFVSNVVTNDMGAMKGGKTEVDLEDMLQGSIIPKNTNIARTEVSTERVERRASTSETLQSGSSFEDFVDEDMDSLSGSELDESNEMEEIDHDPDKSQTRLSNNPFACQYCYCPNVGSIDHLVFDNSDALSQHFFDVHDPNLPYTCPYCPQKYSSVKQRDYHVRLIHAMALKADKCEYCKKTLRSPRELHEFSCQYVGDWRCESCGHCFYQVPLNRFRTHQRQHDPSKQFRCRDCGRVFMRRANLEAHERVHRTPTDSMINCDQCKGVFSSDYELRRHKYQTHNGALPVKCEYCNKGFVSMAFLSRHIQHFHPEKLDANNIDAATCTNCGNTFGSLHKLRIHVQRPRDENGRCIEMTRDNNQCKERARKLRQQRLYACPHCSRRFSVRATLEKHLCTHAAPPRSYECEQCATRCYNAYELKRHISQVHATPRHFTCNRCDKHFSFFRELQQHQKLHGTVVLDKTLQCTVLNCGFVASCAQEASDHGRLKHNLTACEYCSKLFTRKRLATHLRTVHRSEVYAEISHNNTNVQEQQMEESIAVASILEADVPLNNNELVTPFDEQSFDGEEKVRVELLDHGGSISNLVLQEQTSNTFKPLIPTADDMEQNLFMNALLDPDHEIIVT